MLSFFTLSPCVAKGLSLLVLAYFPVRLKTFCFAPYDCSWFAFIENI